MHWYMREASVALLVCNLPFVWSLLSDCFPPVRRWAEGGRSGQGWEREVTFWDQGKRHWLAGKLLGRKGKAEIDLAFGTECGTAQSSTICSAGCGNKDIELTSTTVTTTTEDTLWSPTTSEKGGMRHGV
jgi:hypothetical protein